MSRKRGWDHNFFKNSRNNLEVIAHRGGLEKYPEETIEAFDHARTLNVGRFRVDVLELDVHLTKADEKNPSVLVLMHDEKVDRTTDKTGLLKEFTYNKVFELDAGCRFTLDGKTFPYSRDKGKHYHVPRLEDVFKEFENHRMVIEIKQKNPSIFEALGNLIINHDSQYKDDLPDRVKLRDRVLVASQYHSELKKFRRRFPDIATSASGYEMGKFALMSLINPRKVKINDFDAIQMVATLDEVKLPFLHIKFLPFKRLFPFFNKRVVEAAESNELPIHAWTVNREEDMEKLIELGVNGIITDNPERLLKLLSRLNPPVSSGGANLQKSAAEPKIETEKV